MRYETVGSTNTVAAEHARKGAAEGLCILAAEQTEGRGRHGRKWVSNRGHGLYFSILLRPTLELRDFPLITLAAGIAVHETLKGFGARSDIKWVNDLIINEKKVGGILSETVETPLGLAVIVGIGVNLRSHGFSGELAENATSVEQVTGHRISADDFADALVHNLKDVYERLQRENGSSVIVDLWRERSSYFKGKPVRVTDNNATIQGITDGLEANGALRLKLSDGSVKIVQAGDVQLLRPEMSSALSDGDNEG